MNENLSWTLAGIVAGLALLSLTTTGAEGVSAPQPKLTLAELESTTVPARGGRLPSDLLAEAYFGLARDETRPAGFDDWYIRHEITVKGLAAQRGETLLPEDPAAHSLPAGERAAFGLAQRSLTEWQDYLAKNNPPSGSAVLPLFAALQARYDWWLFLTEAGAPADAVEAAHARYDDLRLALLAAAQQSRVATL